MADTKIDILDASSGANNSRSMGPVWQETDADTVYAFGKDAGDVFVVLKSADAGVSWGSPQTLITGKNVDRFALWYDKWTSGDTGTIVHIIFANTTDTEFSYFSFDTSDDTETGIVTAAALTPATDPQQSISICKTRGGNLVAGGSPTGSVSPDQFFTRSTDSGANWTVKADFSTSTEWLYFLCVPGNETDDNDVWAIISERPNAEVTFAVYDDSADSWSETVLDDSGTFLRRNIAAAVRHSDGHVFVVMSEGVGEGTKLLSWDINGASSITVRTDVTTGTNETVFPAMFIDQATGKIYVVYGEDAPAPNVVYRISGIFPQR